MRPLRLPRLALFAFAGVSALALAQTATQAPTLSAEQRETVLTAMTKLITEKAFVPGVDFSKWPETLAKHRQTIDKTKDQFEFTRSVNKALAEYGFSHIVLYSPSMAEARVNRKMVGIGVRIQLEQNGIRVTGVFPKSPAAETGILPGDLIVSADDKPVRSPRDIAGQEGTTVKVGVIRDGQMREMNVVRRTFSTDMPETLRSADERTYILEIPTFDVGYNAARVNELMKEALEGDRLILDLRNNGGGRVVNLQHLAGYFLTREQPLGTFVDRRMLAAYKKATGKEGTDVREVAAWSPRKLSPVPRERRFEGQIVVLINGGTGSASEIMAAALRDQLGAKIVGTKSAGAVLASVMEQVGEGFVLQYPVTDYIAPKGLRVEGNGVSPDVMTLPNRFGEADNAVAQALKILETADADYGRFSSK